MKIVMIRSYAITVSIGKVKKRQISAKKFLKVHLFRLKICVRIVIRRIEIFNIVLDKSALFVLKNTKFLLFHQYKYCRLCPIYTKVQSLRLRACIFFKYLYEIYSFLSGLFRLETLSFTCILQSLCFFTFFNKYICNLI